MQIGYYLTIIRNKEASACIGAVTIKLFLCQRLFVIRLSIYEYKGDKTKRIKVE